MNTSLVVFLVITILLLFACMILSAMASSKANDKDNVSAHKYSMIAALINGLSVAALIVILAIYVYTSRQEIGHAIAGVAPAPS